MDDEISLIIKPTPIDLLEGLIGVYQIRIELTNLFMDA